MVRTLSFRGNQGFLQVPSFWMGNPPEVEKLNRRRTEPSQYRGFLSFRKNPRGQMKIQQMAFMIMAVFIFFVLVGLFFLRIQFNNLDENFERLQREQTIASLQVISNMPELNCDSKTSMCLDLDKLKIMSGGIGQEYEDLWPVASVKVYMVYPSFSSAIKCPKQNCNYYELYNSGQTNVEEYSTFVSVCEKIEENGLVYDKCKIGKLAAGVVIKDDE